MVFFSATAVPPQEIGLSTYAGYQIWTEKSRRTQNPFSYLRRGIGEWGEEEAPLTSQGKREYDKYSGNVTGQAFYKGVS
jgi:hypothetical protein